MVGIGYILSEVEKKTKNLASDNYGVIPRWVRSVVYSTCRHKGESDRSWRPHTGLDM